VQTLAAAGELQRELTYDRLRAAEAKGSKGGRRPAIKTDKTDAVLTAADRSVTWRDAGDGVA
jgi:hypothetical protein